jgi:hypothetical protein
MNDRWSAVLQFGVAVLGGGMVLGYCLGRSRPLHKARDWAAWEVRIGKGPGRVKGAAIIVLLPEMFVPLIWHRIRHGRYPHPPPRRRAPMPALIERPYRPTEGDTDA